MLKHKQWGVMMAVDGDVEKKQLIGYMKEGKYGGR